MVAASSTHCSTRKIQGFGIPTIDMSLDKYLVCDKIVQACEKYGFFKLVNHGVPNQIISSMEKESYDFFSKPAFEKQEAGSPSPFGYGCKSIGLKGDMGELEYILLEANAASISRRSITMSTDPEKFSNILSEYVQTIKGLSCLVLDLMAQGLGIPEKSLSCLIKDIDNDSCFRVNHYPPFDGNSDENSTNCPLVGFGEHCDPQILTILRSNNVGGLQIYSEDNQWISVPPNPAEFCVIVGDALQVLTNERFRSVRHRVVANSNKQSRISMMYFGAPSLTASLSPILQQTVSPHWPRIYKTFTWGDYKKAVYSGRLGDRRLDFFKLA